jgi:isopentenyl diphosphate isomerase/L-lactate dehydrogenase-like FMN-dependent dehydrogenase
VGAPLLPQIALRDNGVLRNSGNSGFSSLELEGSIFVYSISGHLILFCCFNQEHNFSPGRESAMEYGELMKMAEANLRAKGILESYKILENYQREGAETNFVGRFNVRYFERFGFKFRMIDSHEASTEATLFNRKFETPILSAALSGLIDITEKSLREIALGVGNSGSMMWVGIASAEQVKDVLKTEVPTVRIVKPFQDVEMMIKELKEAEAGGAIAVGTDIDFFYGGKRGDRTFAPKAMAPKSLTALKELAGVTSLPFILKGVLSTQDAEKALEIGAGGIVVSNHGGAIIDYAAHPLEVLPEIKEVIGNQMPIFADSGFRRGSDVMKALALGADAVLIGWPLVMGLAANGSQGVAEMITILTAELRRIMSVTGCKNLSEIDDKILVKRDFFI